MPWSTDVLSRLRDDDEIVLDLQRAGHDDIHVPVWMVVVDGQVFARSYKGVGSMWYRRVVANAAQAITVGGSRVEVTFTPVEGMSAREITAEMRRKYSRFGPGFVDPMENPPAVKATVLIQPRP